MLVFMLIPPQLWKLFQAIHLQLIIHLWIITKGECALPDTFDYSFFDEPGYLGNYGILSESCSYLV